MPALIFLAFLQSPQIDRDLRSALDILDQHAAALVRTVQVMAAQVEYRRKHRRRRRITLGLWR